MAPLNIDPSSIRDISSLVLDENNNLKVVPSWVYARTTFEERALFGHRNAQYGFLTTELVGWLRYYIGTRKAIEIGAGSGVLAKALGITGTDNHQQNEPNVQEHYAMLNQPTISYGKNVQNKDAAEAVRELKPEVVIASWVTHKYDPKRHEVGGNQSGVDEEDIIANCDAYVFIGNSRVHAGKSIWTLPHAKIEPDWLYSRSHGGQDFIAVWRRDGEIENLIV